MPTNNEPYDNYPLSTNDGKAIPLDVLKPRSLIYHTFAIDAFLPITLSAKSALAIIYASEDCVLVFADAGIEFLEDVEYEDALFVPKGHAITAAVREGLVYIRGATIAGTVYIQTIEKWAGLATTTQYNTR